MVENKTAKELYDYRVKLIKDAQSWKKPDRIPINTNMFTWMFMDEGYTTAVAARDYDIIDKCTTRFVEKYKVDQINVLNSGFRNTFLVTDSLGAGSNYNDQNGMNLNAIIEDLVTPDDYEAFTKTGDFIKLLWEKILFRKYPNAQGYTSEQFALAAKTMKDYNDARARTDTKLRDQYGIVIETKPVLFQNGFELFTIYLRGIKSISMDLRRCPEKLYAACDAISEMNYQNCVAAIMGEDATAMNQVVSSALKNEKGVEEPYDIVIGLLAHTIVNQKQFDRLYAPYFDKLLRLAEEKGKHVLFYSEGSWERFGDFFNGYKKGTVAMMVEQDDPYEIRKKYPNICILGGLDTDIMGNGTPQQCVSMAKRAIDELGSDGGLILMPNKMISYSYDMTADNLKAVCDFASEYKL